MKKTFEASVKRLDEIVHMMEKGDISLENAMKLFEEGNAIVKFCQTQLDEAEQKVKLLGANAEFGAWEEADDGDAGAV